jgi:hypothetical protein
MHLIAIIGRKNVLDILSGPLILMLRNGFYSTFSCLADAGKSIAGNCRKFIP